MTMKTVAVKASGVVERVRNVEVVVKVACMELEGQEN